VFHLIICTEIQVGGAPRRQTRRRTHTPQRPPERCSGGGGAQFSVTSLPTPIYFPSSLTYQSPQVSARARSALYAPPSPTLAYPRLPSPTLASPPLPAPFLPSPPILPSSTSPRHAALPATMTTRSLRSLTLAPRCARSASCCSCAPAPAARNKRLCLFLPCFSFPPHLLVLPPSSSRPLTLRCQVALLPSTRTLPLVALCAHISFSFLHLLFLFPLFRPPSSFSSSSSPLLNTVRYWCVCVCAPSLTTVILIAALLRGTCGALCHFIPFPFFLHLFLSSLSFTSVLPLPPLH